MNPSQNRPQKLTVVMPVYNERFTVEQVLDAVMAAPLPGGMDREVIVVDDASTDGSWDSICRASEKHPAIRSVRQEKNQGKGAAVRRGIQMATGDVTVIQDADLEYDPNQYAQLLVPILQGDADVVYGSRFLTSGYRRALYFWHTLGNRLLTLMSNILTDLNLTDMETCYKMSRTSILQSIPIRCNRFGVEVELTAKFAKRRCRIYEVPITYKGRTYEQGKKITWKDGVKAVAAMLYFFIVDDAYDATHGHDILQSLSKAHRFNRWMADTIRPWVGSQVLEIGAGMGNLSAQFLPRESYIASDIDDLHLDFLRNFFADNRRVTVAKINVEQDEDFASYQAQVDTVICLNVVEHVEHDEKAMKNIFSVLKPGGYALVLVPQGQWLYGSLDKVLGHYRRYSPDQLKSLAEVAGFEVEKMISFNKMAVPGWYLNAKIMKKDYFSKVQLKFYDSLVWLWRLIDPLLPWKGVSNIVVARKPRS